MWAVTVTQPGSPATLAWTEVPDPEMGPGDVLIDVVASGVNRADLLQAAGHYPPPPGASELLGLECSGIVAEVGAAVRDWAPGDRVCALLAGGGYAERVAVRAEQVLPVPVRGLVEAAALPEAACTVWSNLVLTVGLRPGSTVLVHGGGSGIGTMAIQVAARLGARVATTASRQTTLDACRRLGADILVDYMSEDFVTMVRDATDGRGADVILDLLGAEYLQRNIDVLADGGRLVIIGLQGGARGELDINALMRKRGGILGTTLRSRPITGRGSKAEIVAAVRDELWPLIETGDVRPVVDAVFDLPDAAAAHRRMAAGGHVGKIVLRAPGRGSPALEEPEGETG
jgi:putative PIG3 family NAD(P)H quinone oxidoreductase